MKKSVGLSPIRAMPMPGWMIQRTISFWLIRHLNSMERLVEWA